MISMPYIPAGHFAINHRVFITGDPEPMIYSLAASIGTGGDASSWPDIIFDAWVENLGPEHNNNCTLDAVEIQIGPQGSVITYESSAASVGGDVTGLSPPPNVAMLVQKHTGQGGRRNRGRMFLPGMYSVNALDSAGNWASGNLDAAQTAVDDYLTDLGSMSFIEDVELLHTGATPAPTPITQLVVQGKAATQRRRLRR